MVEGFCFGLVSASFLAYYSDIKLQLYFDNVGLLIAAYFLLKGLGSEIFQQKKSFKNIYKYIFVGSNILLILSAIFWSRFLNIICLLICFPAWHYGRMQLELIQAKKPRQILDWLQVCQGMGAAIGIGASSYFFTILYFKPIFLLIFAIFAVVRLINSYFIGRLGSNEKANQTSSLSEASI